MTSTTLSGPRHGRATSTSARRYSSGNPQTFGEPAIFPGGISFGSVQFVDGQFATDGAQEHDRGRQPPARQGNDTLDVQGTLDPTSRSSSPARRQDRADAPAASRSTRPAAVRLEGAGLPRRPASRSPASPRPGPSRGFADDNPADTVDNTVMLLDRHGAPQPSQAVRTVTAADVPVTRRPPSPSPATPTGGIVTRSERQLDRRRLHAPASS